MALREIIFRGKRKDNDEWFYGDLRQYSETRKGIFDYKSQRMMKGIIPETIGQFTGLTDKNGTKIFEGDILKTPKFIGVVKYNEVVASFIVEINDTTTGYLHWSPLNEGDPSRCLQLQYTEKISTIHDNPELLEVGENA